MADGAARTGRRTSRARIPDDVPEPVISHAFARGEPWALEATYERWSALVYTFALRDAPRRGGRSRT